jgi:hypothetical protein
VKVASWRKSSYSYETNCVEVGSAPGLVGVRDSKDPNSAVLLFGCRSWTTFLVGLKDGDALGNAA